MQHSFRLIAHRGFSGRYPENTMAAFRAAMELGCGWIETDVRRTADGVAVLFHDAMVNRTTDGTGLISELTWEAVSRLDAGLWKGERFRGERVPTLKHLLAMIAGRAQLVIELKLPARHVEEVVASVRDAGAVGWTVASAFAWRTILRVRRLAPDWRTTWLTALADIEPAEAIARCVEAGVETLAPVAERTDRALVEAAHRAGLLVRCWGVGDDRGPVIRRLLEIGVDGMTTNRPDVLREILRERD